MANDVIPTGPFGERVQQRLRDEQVIWFTTVGRDGTPQPNPVWFLWDGETVLVYNHHAANRLVHIRRRPQVSLNFNDEGGSNVVVFKGHAEPLEDCPPPHEQAGYLEKYQSGMVTVSGSLEAFSGTYSVPLRIHLEGVRGV